MPCDPNTYFGVWPQAKLKRAVEILSAAGIRYEIQEEELDQGTLENWYAWDPNAENPNLGFNLWILHEDVPKLGTIILDEFPERKFGAENSN